MFPERVRQTRGESCLWQEVNSLILRGEGGGDFQNDWGSKDKVLNASTKMRLSVSTERIEEPRPCDDRKSYEEKRKGRSEQWEGCGLKGEET